MRDVVDVAVPTGCPRLPERYEARGLVDYLQGNVSREVNSTAP